MPQIGNGAWVYVCSKHPLLQVKLLLSAPSHVIPTSSYTFSVHSLRFSYSSLAFPASVFPITGVEPSVCREGKARHPLIHRRGLHIDDGLPCAHIARRPGSAVANVAPCAVVSQPQVCLVNRRRRTRETRSQHICEKG